MHEDSNDTLLRQTNKSCHSHCTVDLLGSFCNQLSIGEWNFFVPFLNEEFFSLLFWSLCGAQAWPRMACFKDGYGWLTAAVLQSRRQAVSCCWQLPCSDKRPPCGVRHSQKTHSRSPRMTPILTVLQNRLHFYLRRGWGSNRGAILQSKFSHGHCLVFYLLNYQIHLFFKKIPS